jgi:hypothetical protein
MKTFTLYDNQGQTWGVVTGSDLSPDQMLGYHCIEGSYNTEYYIDQAQAVLKGPDPSTDDLIYNFNYTTKSWTVDLAKTQHSLRTKRNTLLQDVDAITAVWYNSLGQQQQAELQAYRLALLAVPQQAGFPTQVEWPTKPIWL